MRRSVRVLPVILLTLCLTSCGENFAQNLRLTLALSAPLIDSLVDTGAIPRSVRGPLIGDFTDLANGAATLSDNLKSCGSDKTCKLEAVQEYYATFTMVVARGHFGAHERLQKIERVIQGILDAAVIYYGGRSLSKTAAVVNPAIAKQRVEDGLKELKVEMQRR